LNLLLSICYILFVLKIYVILEREKVSTKEAKFFIFLFFYI